ncbi:protein-tyrosine-phosphatase MKP1-like [Malania oleifera]|uniref:protein-tyrosine-phosphatase MKP1-like n=1 Tax=Malania oleifera TaxID=397392 RepID=UPI0025AEAAC0|nr:protein-tyrosine-phosphatase MKP1-like [Malania oleifera]
MLGEEDKERLSAGGGGARKTYLRSVSWTDGSPSNPNRRPLGSGKGRPCLPPLQPLSISRRSVEEWPNAGSDDLGIWPHPPTPRARVRPVTPLEDLELEQPPREFQFKKDKLAFFDKECSRIADHIYLGSDAVAKNREILRQNGITHVLNCVGFVCPEYFKSDLVYKTLWLQDSPSEDITSILYDVFDYFEDVREQGGRVLVHCCQGVSRSTSLVIAYLIWREGQSFEDAFQYVKAARGVTNPNMGFACQLLQCQKRVHALPASPSSVLRMYRMAPHSSYDPLHLVPKMLNHPTVASLDSRGSFIVHVPSAIYVWVGKKCNPVMSNNARAAAFQVIRYERAQGPIVSINEGEEPSEFWDALANAQILAGNSEKADDKEESLSSRTDKNAVPIPLMISARKVDKYDLDFEVFHKALAGGVVPPFPLSGTGSETCLPARENGWGRLRRKFANGSMKEFVMSSKLSLCTTQTSHTPDRIADTCDKVVNPVSPTDPPLRSTVSHGSPDSSTCFPNSPTDACKVVEHSAPFSDPFLSPKPACDSPNFFSYFPASSPKCSSKSPSLSPSTSDYSSSFTFSPSSSNWSDPSYLSSQPSPSGLESADLFSAKNASLAENACMTCKPNPPSYIEAFAANNGLRATNTCWSCKGPPPSIAERRGSNPPARMLLPSIDEASQAHRNMARSWSFSLPELHDDVMEDVDCIQFEREDFHEVNREEPMLDSSIFCANNSFLSGLKDKKESDVHFPSSETTSRVAATDIPVLYQWPTIDKVEIHCSSSLDSRSVYFMFAPNMNIGKDNPDVIYVWLGHDVSGEERLGQAVDHGGSYERSRVHWESVGHKFLNQMGLPMNASVQIVRQGKEPEQFLNHLKSLISGAG